jgi:hypothetical protein
MSKNISARMKTDESLNIWLQNQHLVAEFYTEVAAFQGHSIVSTADTTVAM